ncbi:mediator of RNA polymerase II transcription subunit 17 [Patella vulgata]|uniref:mediator of RNA polymerase II transcription subunit 17 n=1 Tax=Patella vulgata TaxID=6465 RepID=UPI0024A8EA69|nr:mediator of RNA polymerase II transcription subunit 17 [Patella vulgata]
MAVSSVTVSVEPVLESKIQEVKLDGQEIYVPPLSMSENLTKLAHKIDFYKDESDEKGKPTSEGEKDEAEEKVLTSFEQPSWVWDSVRNKLKAAFTEMAVLTDVLNIIKEKRYMVADPVSQDQPDNKPSVLLLAKKRGLVSAGSVLISGAERLKRSHSEHSNRAQDDYFIELLKIRQNWRLKKVGASILGDLTYKTAGSRFFQGGTFEVTKIVDDKTDTSTSHSRGSLEVIIPSELEGVAYIQVEVKSVPEMMDLTSVTLKMPAGLGVIRSDAYWQNKLEVAQNVLFCKELFAQLAREAVQIKSSTPHIVVGNQIITNAFPGIQLSIVLCHYTGKEKKIPQAPQKLEHNHVLEHSLHQLLREVHFKNINYVAPHPVNAMLGMSKRRRLAGPQGTSRRELVEMNVRDTLLEQIIKQTKHAVLRLRTMHVLDELALCIQDPQITAHWSCLNSSLECSVRINITAYGYEAVRSSLVLIIEVDTIQAILKDSRTITLSFEDKALQDLILWQISQHHIQVVQQLAKFHAWTVVSTNFNVGVGDIDLYGTAASLMMASPKGDKILAFRSGAYNKIQMYLKEIDPSEVVDTSPAVTNPKWQKIIGTFQAVDVEKLHGKTFSQKVDMVMAKLTSMS